MPYRKLAATLLLTVFPNVARAQAAASAPTRPTSTSNAPATPVPPAAAPPAAAPPASLPPPPAGYQYVPVAPAATPPASLPPPPAGYQYVPVAPAATPPASLPPPPAGYQYVPLRGPGSPNYAPKSPEGPPAELPYDPSAPVPHGYRLREEPRRGLLIAGYIVTGIPYGISVMSALGADFRNASGYLLVPFVGPWLTMGRRNYAHCPSSSSSNDGLACVADAFVVFALVMDGMIQVAGGTLLLTGYVATSKKLVRNDIAWQLRPVTIGNGYGVAASGQF